jgi:hypothetical protein
MKRCAVLLLVFALAACGDDGGGGDEAAFCDTLDALSEQVSDGDLADDDGLEDALDTANELAESAADGEQLDAVNEVRNVLADGSTEADEAVEAIQDELGASAEGCDIDEDEFAQAPTTTAAPTTSAPPTTEAPSTTGTTVEDGDAVQVNAREPVPGDIAPEFAALAQACFDGDMTACDELFNTTPAGSVDEAYGDACGGRIDDGQGFDLECADVITGPVDVPAEVVDQATASACQGGDMVACDDLFRSSDSGSIDEAYGGLCGGRVEDTDAFCVDIFGEVAFL